MSRYSFSLKWKNVTISAKIILNFTQVEMCWDLSIKLFDRIIYLIYFCIVYILIFILYSMGKIKAETNQIESAPGDTEYTTL